LPPLKEYGPFLSFRKVELVCLDSSRRKKKRSRKKTRA
jgi:hypothetical protein